MHSESTSASNQLGNVLDAMIPAIVAAAADDRPKEASLSQVDNQYGDKSSNKKVSLRLTGAKMKEVRHVTTPAPRIGSIEELLRFDASSPAGSIKSVREDKPTTAAGALNKAKKHLKTLIGASTKKQEKIDPRLYLQGSIDHDSDSETTLAASRSSSSTLSSLPDLELQAKERQLRREERKRIIAERNPVRSRTNSISDDILPAVLHRRFSRDVESCSSSSMQPCSPVSNNNSPLPLFRFIFCPSK